MTNEPRSDDETGAEILRGIAVIVAAGLALGLGFNALQRSAGSGHGLAWISEEQKLASLETMQTDDPAAPPLETVAGAEPVREDTTARTAAAKRPVADSQRDTPETPDAGAPRSTSPAPPATTPARVAPPAPRPDLPSIPDTQQPLEVQYVTAKKFYDAGAATFVDARSREEYEQGHIPGALHLDFDEVFANPVLAEKLDSKGKPIIAYCGSSECDLSKNLAYALIEGGHRKVLVFTGGTADWTAKGQPLLPGAAPNGNTP